MNKKNVLSIIAVLALVASAVMYKVGRSSSHLSELKDFWWYPLPLAVVCLLVAGTPSKKA